MSLDRAVLVFAGFVVLVSVTLGYIVSPYWFLLTAFAGINMIQSAFTGFCPAAIVFRRLGVKKGLRLRMTEICRAQRLLRARQSQPSKLKSVSRAVPNAARPDRRGRNDAHAQTHEASRRR